MRRWLGIMAALMVVTMTAGCYRCRPNCVAGICDCAPIDFAYHCAVYSGPNGAHAPMSHAEPLPLHPSGGPVKVMPKVID